MSNLIFLYHSNSIQREKLEKNAEMKWCCGYLHTCTLNFRACDSLFCLSELPAILAEFVHWKLKYNFKQILSHCMAWTYWNGSSSEYLKSLHPTLEVYRIVISPFIFPCLILVPSETKVFRWFFFLSGQAILEGWN